MGTTAAAKRSPVHDLPRWDGPLVADLALAVRAEPFSAVGWLFELKLDGWRVLAAKDGASVSLRLRSGRDATASFPGVAAGVRALGVDRALLDGELVVFGSDGRSDFDALRACVTARPRFDNGSKVTACFFDLLAAGEDDLRGLPLVERKRKLAELLDPAPPSLMYVEHVEGQGEQLFDGARRLGLEGVVAKDAASPYRAGRTDSWRKMKVEETSEFVVIGIAAPSDGTFGRSGLVLGAVDGDVLRYVGRVGVGGPEIKALNTVVAQLERSTAPCRGAGRAETWLDPAIVAEVRFLATSRRGLRHAVFVRFRPDKHWRDCV